MLPRISRFPTLQLVLKNSFALMYGMMNYKPRGILCCQRKKFVKFGGYKAKAVHIETPDFDKLRCFNNHTERKHNKMVNYYLGFLICKFETT